MGLEEIVSESHGTNMRQFSGLSLLEENNEEDDRQLLLKDANGFQFKWLKGVSSKVTTHVWPWVLSTCLLGATTLFLFLSPHNHGVCEDSYKTGFDTDLAPARSAIHTKQVRFSGALAYDKNGSLIIEHSAGEPVWTGDPTPEIDALWDHLESASGVLLEGHEADTIRDQTQLDSGYWVTGLDVFHQIHCLNQVRKALYPDYYVARDDPRVYKLHTSHCLDYVRQALLCNADATPVKHGFFDSVGHYGPNFNTLHTCRDIDSLVDWSVSRATRASKGSETGTEPTIFPSS